MRLPGLPKRDSEKQGSSSGSITNGEQQQQQQPIPNSGSKPQKQGQQQQQQLRADHAPQVTNCLNGEWVNQRVLLLHGRAGPPSGPKFESSIIIQHEHDRFPAQTWPVTDTFFKALVELAPGPNKLDLQFLPLEGMPSNAKTQSSFTINYLPVLQNPPLHLAVMLAADSKGTFDCPPETLAKEGNSLAKGIEKVRMAGYLFQAFTGEQMHRHGLGRRVFRLEEEWQPDTLSSQETTPQPLRHTAKVHVIRSSKTREELLHPELAQQNSSGGKTGDLYGIAIEALIAYGAPFDRPCYVSVLLMDSHWDGQLIRGHAALGGGAGQIQLGIFGSHSLHAWPSCFENVVSAFHDTTLTDPRYVGNDANESGSNWEATNIGIGAWLHETGHLLSCPHQPSGVMLRDYVNLNRSFMTTEPYSQRTKSNGPRPCLIEHECAWHRLDVLRFRYHPCFRLPMEYGPPAGAATIYNLGNGLLVTSRAGISLVEIYQENEARGHIEFPNEPQNDVFLFEGDMRERLGPQNKPEQPIKLQIISVNQEQEVIEDMSALLNIVTWAPGYNSPLLQSLKLGLGEMENSHSSTAFFSQAPLVAISKSSLFNFS